MNVTTQVKANHEFLFTMKYLNYQLNALVYSTLFNHISFIVLIYFCSLCFFLLRLFPWRTSFCFLINIWIVFQYNYLLNLFDWKSCLMETWISQMLCELIFFWNTVFYSLHITISMFIWKIKMFLNAKLNWTIHFEFIFSSIHFSLKMFFY